MKSFNNLTYINMSKVIKLKKGLDIKLVGEARKELTQLPLLPTYAVCPEDFVGLTPKLLVKVGDTVKAGTPLFFDKYRPEVLVASPVSGTVTAVNRGEKRKILSVVVTTAGEQTYEEFQVPALGSASKEDVTRTILKAGLWPMVMQRPYGIIANPENTPKTIFVSGFDSAPLAPDMNYVLADEVDNLNAGFEALGKLTPGKVHLSLKAGTNGVLNQVKGVEMHTFEGPHPAGNVGVQIHHIDPINKGDIVWTLDVQNVAILGRLFRTGKVDMSKVVVLDGSEVADARYFRTISGAPIDGILKKSNIANQQSEADIRIISGNVLTGRKVSMDGYLGYYHNQVTVIPEGNKYEMLGWMMPRLNKFSVSHSYFSWLMPNKKYDLDTNLNGGVRAFVVTGLYDKYLPMDIYPMYLLKAILAGDIDKMENLGLYEVIEEDFALCEFVDPSKTAMQQIIRDGINLMIKEL